MVYFLSSWPDEKFIAQCTCPALLLPGLLAWVKGMGGHGLAAKELVAFSPNHPKKEGFSLIWTACLEIWPTAMRWCFHLCWVAT